MMRKILRLLTCDKSMTDDQKAPISASIEMEPTYIQRAEMQLAKEKKSLSLISYDTQQINSMERFKEMPMELMMLLLSFLNIKDQVFFAMTCKAIWKLYTHHTNPYRGWYLYNMYGQENWQLLKTFEDFKKKRAASEVLFFRVANRRTPEIVTSEIETPKIVAKPMLTPIKLVFKFSTA